MILFCVQQISPAPQFPSVACCGRRDVTPIVQQLAAANGPFCRAEIRSENFSTLGCFVNEYRYFTYAGAPAYLAKVNLNLWQITH